MKHSEKPVQKKTDFSEKPEQSGDGRGFSLTVLSAAVIFLSVTLLLGVTVFAPRRNPKGRQTVFLNPAALSSVTGVSIADSGSVLTLLKTGEYWTCRFSAKPNEKNALAFPADSRVVSDFFAALTAPRLVYTVSTGASLWESAGIDDEHATALTFTNSAGESVAGFFFGAAHYSGQSVYFRDNRTLNAYYTKNDIMPFLSIRPEFWADMLLFPQSPKSFALDDVIRIVRTAPETEVFLNAAGTEQAAFETLGRVLLGARASAVLPTEFVLQKESASATETLSGFEPAAEFRLDLADGSKKRLSVYRAENTYLAVPDTLEYCLEISSWTYGRITQKADN